MSLRRRSGWLLAALIALTASVAYAGILDFFVTKNQAAPTQTSKRVQSSTNDKTYHYSGGAVGKSYNGANASYSPLGSRTTSGYSGDQAQYSTLGSRTPSGYNGAKSPVSPNGSRTTNSYQPTKTKFWQ